MKLERRLTRSLLALVATQRRFATPEAAAQALLHAVRWKDRLDFTAMGGNAPRVPADEARALVRWILSSPQPW